MGSTAITPVIDLGLLARRLGLRAVGVQAAVDLLDAEHAERVQHHPDILIRYSRVTLSLSTHDANGITEKDFEFAAAANAIGKDCGAK